MAKKGFRDVRTYWAFNWKIRNIILGTTEHEFESVKNQPRPFNENRDIIQTIFYPTLLHTSEANNHSHVCVCVRTRLRFSTCHAQGVGRNIQRTHTHTSQRSSAMFLIKSIPYALEKCYF